MSELERADLLAKYDEQLRTDAPSAVAVAFLGPLHLVSFPWGQGWVTYRDFSGADGATIRRWVGEVLDHFRSDPAIRSVKWKARGHDVAPGLHEALLGHGFTPGEPESVMIGTARALAVDAPLPEGIVLRRIRAEPDVRRLAQMQREVFGDVDIDNMTTALMHRQSLDDGMELWVAEHQSRIVGSGRLEPVARTEFAGIWGGSTVEAWRGRGLYRALTAARARSALRHGKTLIQSDSTDQSRPILERHGFLAITTVLPYMHELRSSEHDDNRR
jgi:hypothetical protein